MQWGCYAEYVAVPESSVSLMPSKLLFEEAAGVPVAALAARQSLFAKPGIGAGSTVVIHAAAGGVDERLERAVAAVCYGHEHRFRFREGSLDPCLHRLRDLERGETPLELLRRDYDSFHGAGIIDDGAATLPLAPTAGTDEEATCQT